jgi:hypothetical protein
MVIAKKRKKEDAQPDMLQAASDPQEQSTITEKNTDEAPSSASNRVRLSADVEHQAYILIKSYSATVRKPTSIIIQEMIYEHFQK